MARLRVRFLGRHRAGEGPTGQQGPDFYDRTFQEDDSWRRHYTESPYYFVWTVIIDRLRRRNTRRLLEIACGSGQLAKAIADAGIVSDYRGFDFSRARLEFARTSCPGLHFEVADAITTNLFDEFAYDTAIATEFLEHVEQDLAVLRRLRPGTVFVGTVPNFPFVSHVRHFTTAEHVIERYRSLFESLSVVELPANDRGKKFFLLEGVRS
jgi:2-polyprenyl-3-methyl-5-hydroxy-6-metoxy-1,4-benzoquinol methylase